MARRYWIFREGDGERVSKPFDTHADAVRCVDVLNAETPDGQSYTVGR